MLHLKMFLSLWICIVFLAVTNVALISEAKRHGKSEWLKQREKETEAIYTEVLHNITRVNKELQDLLDNYNKLKGIYDQHSSFEGDHKGNEDDSRKEIKHQRSTTDGPTRSFNIPTQMFELIEDDENSTEMEIETKSTTKDKEKIKKTASEDFVLDSEELEELKVDKNKRFKVKHKRKKEKETVATRKQHKRKRKYHKTTPEVSERLERVEEGNDTSSEDDQGTILHYGKLGTSANHKKDKKKVLTDLHNQTKHVYSTVPALNQNETKIEIERNGKGASAKTKQISLYQQENERATRNKRRDIISVRDTPSSDTGSDTDTDMNNSKFLYLRSKPDASDQENKTKMFYRSAPKRFEDEFDNATKEGLHSGLRRAATLFVSRPTMRRSCIEAESKRCKRDLVRKCHRAGKDCVRKVCRVFDCKRGFKDDFDQILRLLCIDNFNASNVSGSSGSGSRSSSNSGSGSSSSSRSRSSSKSRSTSRNSSGSSSSSGSDEIKALTEKTLKGEVSNEQDSKNVTHSDGGKNKSQKKKDEKSKKKKKKNHEKSKKKSEKKKNNMKKNKGTDIEDDSDEDKEAERTETAWMKAVDDLTRHGLPSPTNPRRLSFPELRSGQNIGDSKNLNIKGEKKETERAHEAQILSKLKIGREKYKKKKKSNCCGHGARSICVEVCTMTYQQACVDYECRQNKRRSFKKHCKKFCKLQFSDKSSSSSSGSSSGSDSTGSFSGSGSS